MSNAGPPDRLVFAGFGLGGAIVFVAWWLGLLDHVPWPFWALIPVAILAVISFADYDGWNIRHAMAYVALQQRARWPGPGPIPATPSMAQAWLDDPANAGADGLLKVSVMITAGNLTTARALLEDHVPTNDVQTAAATRIRAYFGARETGIIDMEPIRAVSEGLDEEDRRYQLTAAAWTQAWMDIEARRPWRDRFAATVRGLGPYAVPRRVEGIIGFQQFAAPFAVLLATAIMAVLVVVLRLT
jgi:hypothetical protein